MTDAKEITLIIPTYNRQNYVLRNLNYWSDKNIIVHVFDGSINPIDSGELSGLGSNIFYHHFPTSLVERLEFSINFISTKYVAILADDEFFLYSGLLECTKQLDLDPSYVACAGRSMRIFIQDDEILSEPTYPNAANYDGNSRNVTDRIKQHMHPYKMAALYSVVRADVWAKAIRSFSKTNCTLASYEELAFELATAYQGGIKVLPILYWLRSSEEPPVRHTSYVIEEVHSLRWASHRLWDVERKEFFHNIARSLMSNNNEALYIEQIIKTGFAEYLKSAKKGLRKHNLNFCLQSIKKLIKKFILTPLGFKYKKRHRLPSLFDVVKSMERSGVRVNYEELFEIIKIVNKFHNINIKTEE